MTLKLRGVESCSRVDRWRPGTTEQFGEYHASSNRGRADAMSAGDGLAADVSTAPR